MTEIVKTGIECYFLLPDFNFADTLVGDGLIEHREHLYACSIHSIITVRL